MLIDNDHPVAKTLWATAASYGRERTNEPQHSSMKLKSIFSAGGHTDSLQVEGRHVEWTALLIFVLFFLISLSKAGGFTLDESLFHYPNALNFYENGLSATFNEHYSAANTPLPYIFVAGIAKVVGMSLPLARGITALVSFLAFLIAIQWLKKRGADTLSYFVLLFYPYFFVNSFVFYAVNYGLFFALLGLLVLDKEPLKPLPVLMAGLSFALAVLCQQFYLMVPAAIATSRALAILKRPDTVFLQKLLKISADSLLLFLPLLVPLWLFTQWHGLTHPRFHVHSLAFMPTTITAIFFVIGFTFWPYVWQTRQKITGWALGVSLMAGVLLVALYRPEFSDLQGPGVFTGITYHLLIIPGRLSPWLTTIALVILCGLGLLFYWILARSLATSKDLTLFLICNFLAATYIVNTQIGERHLLALIVFLMLLVLPQLRRPASMIYAAFMAALGVGYFFYWTFIKFGGS